MSGENKNKKQWYVLRLPKSNPKFHKELEAEADYRKKNALPPIEYFAPMFIDISPKNGDIKRERKPLCLNYVFFHSTIEEIRLFRKNYPDYNLIKRKEITNAEEYLYVPDKEMQMFMTIANAYDKVIPCYAPGETNLSKGDRVRIIGGKFTGVEGILLTQKGKDGGIVVLKVYNLLSVPTLSIKPEYIEILSFANNNKHLYKKLDSYEPRIRRAIHHFLSPKGIDETDIAEVSFFLSRFSNVEIESPKIRGRYLTFLMMSHTIFRHEKENARLVKECIKIMPAITNTTTRAFMYSALYVCTRNQQYGTQAREIINTWDFHDLSSKQINILEDLELFEKAIGDKEE